MKLTKKDIATTIGVLMAAFIGIPLVLWSISESRLAAFKNRADAQLRPLIAQSVAEARAAAKVFTDERVADVVIQRNNNYYRFHEYDNYRNEVRNSYPGSQTAVDTACGTLMRSFESSGQRPFDLYPYGSYQSDSCSFIIKTKNGYGKVETEFFRYFEDRVDINFIEGLVTSPDDLPINSHRDGRSMHFLVLVSKDPLVVWNLRVWNKDQ